MKNYNLSKEDLEVERAEAYAEARRIRKGKGNFTMGLSLGDYNWVATWDAETGMICYDGDFVTRYREVLTYVDAIDAWVWADYSTNEPLTHDRDDAISVILDDIDSDIDELLASLELDDIDSDIDE